MGMYNTEQVKNTVNTAEEFIRRAKLVISEHESDEWYGNKSTASLRRQSLELTHELAALRKRD